MSIADINRRLEEKYDDDDEEDNDSNDETYLDSDEEDEEEEVPKWNSFKDSPKESESFSMVGNPLIETSIQILKIGAYLTTFFVVLAGAVFAKLILLLMTSQLTPDRMVTVSCGSMTLAIEIPNVEKYLWVWALLICFAAPEMWTLIRSVRVAVFKGYESEDDNFDSENYEKSIGFKYIFLVTAVMEGLHVIGMAIFVFEVLPHIDVARGVMLTNCVCLVPGILGALSNSGLQNIRKIQISGDLIALLFQISGFLVWPILSGSTSLRVWFLPLSLALISCGWWINYVSEESPFGIVYVFYNLGKNRTFYHGQTECRTGVLLHFRKANKTPVPKQTNVRINGNIIPSTCFVKFLAKIKDTLKDKNIVLYKLYIGISIWKILLFFGSALFILSMQGMDLLEFFTKTQEAFSDREMTANEVDKVQRTFSGVKYPISSIGVKVWWVIFAQIAAAYVSYSFGKFACKIKIQPFSFAFPCALAVPVTLVVIVITTGLRNENLNAFSSFLPGYLFFNSPQIYDVFEFFFFEYGWVWLLWIISHIWITFHIWIPRCERLSETEALFATPMYSAFLTDQSMTMNRRRDKIEILENIFEDNTPHIIACATMWHEEKAEMLEMLKSLLRMDNDQCLRRRDKIINPDDIEVENNYYTFESHIFFDDAFELENEDTDRTVMNKFVRNFIKTISKAAKDVYGTDDVWIKPPLKYSTPYGGRLEYTLPGDTKLYVHLKDKDKIRHKKRWSQVMYMYYLLGFKLMEQKIPHEEIMNKAKNTYLMALDGDIDFKPDAVLLLVDLMKKNKSLGAACGRIHPVGSGFMVWYQLFEYAIGHWLQKATEHMIGCVLCSPGCFSLFRAKALMSPNVMKRYTTKAEEARHYVQYDQGEDRWLCTLLLQRGYRVEYSAASDAYTHCPETFDEFYNQRRRWIPSTVANVIDLLNDYKRTVRVNNSISMPYIAYQMIMMAGTILGPGTILLMLVGAFNSAFKIDNWTALYYNLIPIAAFILCCLFTSGKFQLSAALIISLVYGLVMMAVLVGIVMEISDDGFLSPSSLFLFITAFEIIIAAVFHPQEFFCLFCGVIYYVTIPSMYLLLIIYSVCNLNVISWGTREVAKKKTKADLENEKKEAELAEKKAEKNRLLGIFDTLSSGQKKENKGNLGFSFSSVFNCLCCTDEKQTQTTEQFAKIGDTLNVLKTKIDNIERNIEGGTPFELKSPVSRISVKPRESITMPKNDNVLIKSSEDEDEKEMRDDLFNPYWIEDKCLKDSKFEVLSIEETKFWIDLIKQYLSPLNPDAQKEKDISKNLKDLRDKMVITFFMLNALFVVIIFLLQVNKDQIHIKWPLGAKANITFNPVTYEITIQKTYLQLEPVGLVFISFFASILIIQFLAMLFHRFETLCHLLSNTPLTLFKGKKNISYREKLEIARKKFNRQKQDSDDAPRKSMIDEKILQTNEIPTERRKSKLPSVDQMFHEILTELKEKEEREEAEKIEKRKSSILPWKRNSIQPKRLSKAPSVVSLKLPKIDEEGLESSRI